MRHCVSSRMFADSIPDSVIGIFHWHNPSGRTVALGSTQSLTEMNTRNISCGGGGGGEGAKAAGTHNCKPCHLQVPIVSKFGSLDLLEPSGPVLGLHKDCFNFAL